MCRIIIISYCISWHNSFKYLMNLTHPLSSIIEFATVVNFYYCKPSLHVFAVAKTIILSLLF